MEKEERFCITTRYVGLSIGIDRNPAGWKFGIYLSFIFISIIINFKEIDDLLK